MYLHHNCLLIYSLLPASFCRSLIRVNLKAFHTILFIFFSCSSLNASCAHFSSKHSFLLSSSSYSPASLWPDVSPGGQVLTQEPSLFSSGKTAGTSILY